MQKKFNQKNWIGWFWCSLWKYVVIFRWSSVYKQQSEMKVLIHTKLLDDIDMGFEMIVFVQEITITYFKIAVYGSGTGIVDTNFFITAFFLTPRNLSLNNLYKRLNVLIAKIAIIMKNMYETCLLMTWTWSSTMMLLLIGPAEWISVSSFELFPPIFSIFLLFTIIVFTT